MNGTGINDLPKKLILHIPSFTIVLNLGKLRPSPFKIER